MATTGRESAGPMNFIFSSHTTHINFPSADPSPSLTPLPTLKRVGVHCHLTSVHWFVSKEEHCSFLLLVDGCELLSMTTTTSLTEAYLFSPPPFLSFPVPSAQPMSQCWRWCTRSQSHMGKLVAVMQRLRRRPHPSPSATSATRAPARDRPNLKNV